MKPSTHARIDPPTVLGDMAELDRALAPSALDAARSTSLHTLPEGTRLLDYEIVGLVGEGGFGIVYLAYDAVLERHVAIKEYLPAVMASRASTQAVMVKSERHADSFRTGLRSFVNEARLLARFDHPSLVKVLRFWEGNGTAYMVMPFYEGPTLAHTLQTLGRAPTEEELLGWLRPLLHALSTLHAVRCYHRDIAPDNILLTPAGPLLLDFGAARRVVGQVVAAPTVVIKPGYAPIEQYGEAPSLKQGPWTDLYAMAGVVHAAITGAPPLAAVERWIEDRLIPVSELAKGRYSAHFLAAVDAALALRPADRPADAAEFWARLNGPNAAHAPWAAPTPSVFAEAPSPSPAPAPALDSAEPEPTLASEQTVAMEPEAPITAEPITLPERLPEVALVQTQPPSWTLAVAHEKPSRKPWGRYALIAILLAALLAMAMWGADRWQTRPMPESPPITLPPPREAPKVSATPPTAAPAPVIAPAREPAAVAPAPKTTPTPTRVLREPAPAPAPAPVAVAAPVAAPRERERVKPAPANTTDATRRCADLLQRGSIEPLRPADLAFLKRECRP